MRIAVCLFVLARGKGGTCHPGQSFKILGIGTVLRAVGAESGFRGAEIVMVERIADIFDDTGGCDRGESQDQHKETGTHVFMMKGIGESCKGRIADVPSSFD